MTDDNPRDHLDRAREAFRDGNFPVALERYEYFFDHALDNDTAALYGVRLSYCLDEWERLGQKYPPALRRLEEKKNEALNLFKETRNPQWFNDYKAICKYLKLANDPVEIFLSIHSSDPDLAKSTFRFIRDDLVKAEQWNVCAIYIEDAMNAYTFFMNRFDEILKIHREEGWDESHPKRTISRDITNLLLVLKNTHQNDDVEKLQKALASDMSSRNMPEISSEIIRAAGL